MVRKEITGNDRNMEDKIREAAEKLFLEKGHNSTSTTDIAREAGCNQALVHYYYRTKDRLFGLILGSRVKAFLTDFLTLEMGSGTFEEKITRLIGMYFDLLRQNSNMLLFIINEFTRNPDQFNEMIAGLGNLPDRSFHSLERDMKAEIDAGHIRDISVRQFLLNIISLSAMVFAIKPIYQKIWKLDDRQFEAMLDTRKKEIITTVLISLRPI